MLELQRVLGKALRILSCIFYHLPADVIGTVLELSDVPVGVTDLCWVQRSPHMWTPVILWAVNKGTNNKMFLNKL